MRGYRIYPQKRIPDAIRSFDGPLMFGIILLWA